MSKVEIKANNNWFAIQLISSDQLVMTIANDDESKTSLFQKIVTYQAFDAEIKFLFQNIQEIFDALAASITSNAGEHFQAESCGRVHFRLEVKIFEKIIKKHLAFELEKKLKCEQEVHILRANLHSARKQIADIRKQVERITQENNQLKAKFTYLEELITAKLANKYQQAFIQKHQQAYIQKQPEEPSVKNATQNGAQSKQMASHIQTQIEQEINQQCLKVVPLKVEIDEACMYYSKFTISSNTISSLYQDYYQIYCKEPLPKRGIYSLKVKMMGENHLSIGLLAKSALNNQYSFQNNKAVCFYSYFYGNFRGIYFRSKYQPLNWSMQTGEVIHFEIDMNKKMMKIGSKGRKATEVINFKSLYDEEPVYFFIEMYEKNNCIQFVQ